MPSYAVLRVNDYWERHRDQGSEHPVSAAPEETGLPGWIASEVEEFEILIMGLGEGGVSFIRDMAAQNLPWIESLIEIPAAVGPDCFADYEQRIKKVVLQFMIFEGGDDRLVEQIRGVLQRPAASNLYTFVLVVGEGLHFSLLCTHPRYTTIQLADVCGAVESPLSFEQQYAEAVTLIHSVSMAVLNHSFIGFDVVDFIALLGGGTTTVARVNCSAIGSLDECGEALLGNMARDDIDFTDFDYAVAIGVWGKGLGLNEWVDLLGKLESAFPNIDYILSAIPLDKDCSGGLCLTLLMGKELKPGHSPASDLLL